MSLVVERVEESSQTILLVSWPFTAMLVMGHLACNYSDVKSIKMLSSKMPTSIAHITSDIATFAQISAKHAALILATFSFPSIVITSTVKKMCEFGYCCRNNTERTTYNTAELISYDNLPRCWACWRLLLECAANLTVHETSAASVPFYIRLLITFWGPITDATIFVLPHVN